MRIEVRQQVLVCQRDTHALGANPAAHRHDLVRLRSRGHGRGECGNALQEDTSFHTILSPPSEHSTTGETSSMRYRIGEFARLAGVPVKTLRYYDTIGLLSPAAVDSRTQYRLYASRQLQDVAAIRALKALGASLNDIRQVTGRQESRRERSELLWKLKRNALGSIESAQRTLAWIDDALEELHAEREVPIVLKQRAAIRVSVGARTSQEL
jgi:DNA-binding transcriptional MerR regulator